MDTMATPSGLMTLSGQEIGNFQQGHASRRTSLQDSGAQALCVSLCFGLVLGGGHLAMIVVPYR